MLFVLKNGRGRVLIDFEEYQFLGPAFCLIRPEQVHSLLEYQYPEGWLVSFDPGLLAPELVPLIQVVNLISVPAFKAEELATIHSLADLLCTFFESDYSRPFTQQTLLNSLVSAICDLYQSVRHTSEHPENRSDEIVASFRKLVETRYIDWKRPAQYAEALHLSLNHLTDTVKQKTGFPVSYWIQYQTMLEARRLLFHTQSPVKDIAYQLGFLDQHYFSRLFRKATGQTPLAFRQSFHDLSTKTLL